MNKLAIAVVGCGDIAGFSALMARLVPQVNFIACCDVNQPRAQTFAKRHRIQQVFTDYAELLAKASAEEVYLAVPHYLHYEMILAALAAGNAVFVEKPLTRMLAEGLKLVEALEGRKVGVNYQYRYDRNCYALGQAIRAGAMGHVHSVRINIPRHRTQSYFDGAPWHRTISQTGGGTLITQGSHFLDVGCRRWVSRRFQPWGAHPPPVSK